LMILGIAVTVCSFFAFAVRFSEADERAVAQETEDRLGSAVEVQPLPEYAQEAA
jgi:hypothetical protein